MEYSKVSNKEWEEIILKFDNAHFFHSPIWAKILEKTYKHRPATRLYEIEGKEILVPMMERNIHGFKSFDFINDNPLAGGLFSESDITTDDFKAIANDIIGGRNLSFSLALPPFVNLSKGRSSSKIKEDWKVKDEPNIVHILNLEGKNFEYIWKNIYKKSTRKSIRRATKKGVEVRNADSLDDFKAFFNIYSIWVRKWGKSGIAVKLLNNLYKY
ncbi:MAG: peptidoglycan bridge formation glycyltransferase FemA/FemB family protein, partial [Methanobacterium sp.]